MRFLQRLFDQAKKSDSTNALPVNWKQTLRQCNFFMARREISYVFRTANQQAAHEGTEAIWKKDIADGWNHFAENPCYDTAVSLLRTSPALFKYFRGCCPGGALHRIALRTATNFSLGDYSLKTSCDAMPALIELTPQQYTFFPRQFKGEVIYHSRPIEFLGRQWEFRVSSVLDIIYKWAASLELGPNDDVGEIGHSVFQYCEQFLGAPTQEKQGFYFWDTSDGNVILQMSQASDLIAISISATSHEIRNLKRL